VTLTVSVKNTGKVSGSQVVQLYVKDKASFLMRPDKELRGFKKVHLNPNESCEVSFTLSERDFAYYVPHLARFAVESGSFELCVGFSSQDIQTIVELEVTSKDKVRPHLTLDYPYNQWVKYPHEKTQVDRLVAMTRSPFWWDSEPPLIRWLNNLKHEFAWSDEKLDEVKRMLMEEE
jgi:hypothetical protein